MVETKIVATTKSLFGFGLYIGKGRYLYLFSKVSVFADSGETISYCLFTITKNKESYER